VKGQQEATIADSVLLEEVTVHSFQVHKYAAGSKIFTIDSATFSRFRGNTLSEILQQNTPLYLKTYGNGMLSTINMRGTSASHTAVLWNGININSMSLGLTDFSIIPLFGLDKISIHPGAASALYGSDAIGGTINLGSQSNWTRGVRLSIQQELGSFQQYITALSTKYGNGRIEGRTALYNKSLENNFPFINTTRINKPLELQENAAIEQKGIVQDLNFKLFSRSIFSINAWWNETFREVQPTMTVKNNDWQKDRNIKVMAQYHFNISEDFNTQIKAAYLDDVINFNGSESQISRFHGSFEQDLKFFNNLYIKAGIDWNHIIADISGYGLPVTEDRNDVFILTRYIPFKKLLLSLNVRQPFVTGFKAPLAPALGVEYELLNNSSRQLNIKTNASINYRIPTLNDRYWLQGGNKALLPERSHNIETGIVYKANQDIFSSETEFTGFYNDVQNWIAWIPVENFWSAQNIKRVKIRGVEVVQKSTWALNNLLLKFNISYAFSRSTNEESPHHDELGKQLVYMPVHSGFLASEINYRGWFLNPLLNYTGQRFTTSENANRLPSYLLLDVFLGKSFSWKPFGLSAFMRINNITNKIYNNYEFRAMPGRNYLISIRIDVK
jgi:iron complex outermembrane receptor protein